MTNFYAVFLKVTSQKCWSVCHFEKHFDNITVKAEGTYTIWNSSADPADPADPTDPAEVVSSTAARTPPSTRAGGQDDVS